MFDTFMDPLDWFLQEKTIGRSTFMRTAAEAEAAQRAVELQNELIPGLALIARTAQPSVRDMFSVFLNHSNNEHCRTNTPIVIDTGASISCTPFLEDFITELTEIETELTGLSDKINVAGSGTVEWTIRDWFGRVAVVRTTAYHVPEANVRLFSPQTYA